MATEEKIKSFNDYSADDLKQTLDKGPYHLKVTSATSGRQPEGDNNPTLNIRTVVASGEYAGHFGPMKSWELGDVSGNRNSDGAPFHISAQSNRHSLIRDMQAIMDGEDMVFADGLSYDEVMMAEIARQIDGREFYGQVSTGATGWDRLGKLSPMSDPPKGIKDGELASEFTF
jgi:hypothetical protein